MGVEWMGLNVGIAGLDEWLQAGQPPRVAWSVYDVLGSTNTQAAQEWSLATAAPLALPCVLAHTQTAGRGRLGRVWQSALGASVCWSFVWPCPAAACPMLPVAVGLGLAWGLNALLAPGACTGPVRLKWPNDVCVQGRKLAGVLCETVNAAHGQAVVVGVGINRSDQAWGELPPGSVPPTALTEHWQHATLLSEPLRLAQGLWPWVLQALLLLHREGAKALVSAFEPLDVLLGREVLVQQGSGTWHGVGWGLDSTGAYRLQVGSALRLVHSGDVSVRPV